MRVDMTQLLDSMEESIKSQHRARARKRAEKEKAELMAFQEKLRRAAVSRTQLDSMASKIKGTDAAVQRDQLISLCLR